MPLINLCKFNVNRLPLLYCTVYSTGINLMDKERTSPIKRMKVPYMPFYFVSFFLAWVVMKIFIFGFHQFLAKIIMLVVSGLVPLTFRLINIRLPPFLNTYRFRSRMCFFSPIPPPQLKSFPQ